MLSATNEVRAVTSLLEMLAEVVAARETSTEEDERLLEVLTAPPVPSSEATDPYVQGMKEGKKVGEKVAKEKKEAAKEAVTELMKGLAVEEDAQWRSLCAVTYRLTRKRIVDRNIVRLAALEAFYRRKTKQCTGSTSTTEVSLGAGDTSSSGVSVEGAVGDDEAAYELTVEGLSASLRGLTVSRVAVADGRNNQKCDRNRYPCEAEDSSSQEKREKVEIEENFMNKNNTDSSVSANAEAPTITAKKVPLKMTNSEREAAVIRLELNLYIRQANNVKLAIQIAN